MGGFCTTTVQPLPDYSEVVTDTQLPAWVSEGGKRLFEEASSLARSPFPQYTDARIATYNGSKLTPEEQQAAALLSRGATSYQQYIDDAANMASGLGQGFDRTSRADLIGSPFRGMSNNQLMGNYQGASREDLIGTSPEINQFTIDQAQPFLDIYQGAQDSAVNEVQRQTELANMQNRATAARSGAFGGSRLGIQEGLTAGEGARAAGDLRARAAQQGLQFAAQQFGQDRAARLEQAERDRAARFGAENLLRGQFDQDRASRFGLEDMRRGQFEQDRAARFGAEDAARAGFETEEASRLRATEALQGFAPLTQGLRDQAASGLFTAGQARRQLDQQALDMAYADYVEQRNYPQSQINYALGVLQGTPYDTRNISLTQGQQFIQSPSIYGQTLGGLGSLASAYYMSQGRGIGS
tara:strand:+ start:4407 stop:5642 length:1236 start_codon:yes stop_codon:yes gene_type:complete